MFCQISVTRHTLRFLEFQSSRPYLTTPMSRSVHFHLLHTATFCQVCSRVYSPHNDRSTQAIQASHNRVQRAGKSPCCGHTAGRIFSWQMGTQPGLCWLFLKDHTSHAKACVEKQENNCILPLFQSHWINKPLCTAERCNTKHSREM